MSPELPGNTNSSKPYGVLCVTQSLRSGSIIGVLERILAGSHDHHIPPDFLRSSCRSPTSWTLTLSFILSSTDIFAHYILNELRIGHDIPQAPQRFHLGIRYR